MDDDGPIVVIAFFNYDGISIEAAIASSKPWGDRRFLRKVFSYAFEQLGCRRLYVRVDASNVKSVDMNERLGFVHEGTLREAATDGGDTYIMSMLKSEYLKSRWCVHG